MVDGGQLVDETGAESIHLRREPSPVACGTAGRVRVTRVFREVTCQPCIDVEDRRLGRHDEQAADDHAACVTGEAGA